MMNFWDNFITNYKPHLRVRANTFDKIFNYLEGLKQNNYLIVETGTTRNLHAWGDGNATILFDLFIQEYGGQVNTVDIDPDACKVSYENTSNNTLVTIGDSVNYLHRFPNPEDIDLLYLDSFDLDWDNPHSSAFHHMKELTTVYPKLKKGCLIVVDDNENGVGKGQYVAEFLDQVGDKLYFDEYQIGYIKQ